MRNDTRDTTAPTLRTAVADETSLTLTYDEALDSRSEPAASAYTVTVADSTATTVTDVEVSGSAVTLTLQTAVTGGQAVTLTYRVPRENPVQDVVGNDAAAFSNRTVENITGDTTAPTLSEATVNGDTLVLTYGETLDPTSVPPASAYTVSVNGSRGPAVWRVAVDGMEVTLSLANAVTSEQTVTLTYVIPTTPGTTPLRDLAENNAAALSGQEVENNTVSAVTLDIDGDGNALALTDGLLMLRVLLRNRNPALVSLENALGTGATRTTANAIVDYMEGGLLRLDIDGNGDVLALTDGLLVLRVLLRNRNPALVSLENALGTGATRTTANAIVDYVNTLLPP